MAELNFMKIIKYIIAGISAILLSCESRKNDPAASGFSYSSYKSESISENLNKHTFNDNGRNIVIYADSRLGVSKSHITIGGESSVKFADAHNNWATLTWSHSGSDNEVRFNEGGGAYIDGALIANDDKDSWSLVIEGQ